MSSASAASATTATPLVFMETLHPFLQLPSTTDLKYPRNPPPAPHHPLQLNRAVAFVSVGLPSVQKLIAAPFLYAFAIFWSMAMALGVLPSPLSDWYRSHDHDGAKTMEVRRVYIYSPTDALIDYRGVESHAAEAKIKGVDVKLEKYERSAHVAHVRKDEKRYCQDAEVLVIFTKNVRC